MFPLYLCYFTFGFCMSFGSIAMNFEMMETLKFTPVEMTMAVGVVAAPWCIKPVFGLISDKYLIFDWGKRRPYISACGFLLAYIYMLIPKFLETKSSMVASMTMISFLLCFADVCADCITVDHVKKEKVKGKTQGNCWTSRALGSVLGSTFGGSVYQKYGTKVVFQIMSFPVLLMAIFIWNLQINTTDAPQTLFKKISKSVYKKRALVFGIFMINVAPSYGPFYTYYLRQKLKYTPKDFQWMSLSSALSFLASTFLYRTYFLKVEPLKLMWWACILSITCQFVQVLVAINVTSSIYIVVIDTIGRSFFEMLLMMPVIVAVAKHAKEGIEGTFYALLMSVSNLSNVISDELGGLFGNMFGVTRESFDNLGYLVILCTLIDLILQIYIINNRSFASYLQVQEPKDRMRHQKDNKETSDYQEVFEDRTLEMSDYTRDSSVNLYQDDIPEMLDYTRDSSVNENADHTLET